MTFSFSFIASPSQELPETRLDPGQLCLGFGDWLSGWAEFSFAGSSVFPSLVHSNAFLISVVKCERNEQNQPHEQGHPTTSQDDDITISSGPAKTQSSNNGGEGQVILTAG